MIAASRSLSFRRQRGFGLLSLIFWMFIIGFVGVVGLKVVPAYTEYSSILRSINQIETSGVSSVREAREAFDRRASVDYIESIRGSDLDIIQEGGSVKISFSYERRIHLVYNIYLVFEFSN